MAKDLKKGDTVTWKTPQGKTEGKVEGKVTSDTTIKNNKIKASKSDPKVMVKSAKTGAKAAHKPESLDRK